MRLRERRGIGNLKMRRGKDRERRVARATVKTRGESSHCSVILLLSLVQVYSALLTLVCPTGVLFSSQFLCEYIFMYVCMYVCMYVRTYVRTDGCTHARMDGWMDGCKNGVNWPQSTNPDFLTVAHNRGATEAHTEHTNPCVLTHFNHVKNNIKLQ